jgi:hypothetical protein
MILRRGIVQPDAQDVINKPLEGGEALAKLELDATFGQEKVDRGEDDSA